MKKALVIILITLNESLLKTGKAEYSEIEDLIIHRERLKKAWAEGQKARVDQPR